MELDICEHWDLTDEGVCRSCGLDLTSQEFFDSLPEVPVPCFDNILDIIKLAQQTAQDYRNQESHLSWAGCLMARLPSEVMWERILKRTYPYAKQIGYRGDFERWAELCWDYQLLIKNSSG